MYQNISLSYRSIGSMIRDYLNNVLMKTKTKTNYLFIDDHKYEQNLTLWTAVYFAIFSNSFLNF